MQNPLILLAVLAFFVACCNAIPEFDEPPQLPPYFTATASWVQTNSFSTGTGKGPVSLNGQTGQLRVVGTTVWDDGATYDSDALFECGNIDKFYTSYIQVVGGNSSYCNEPDLASVTGWCALVGNGQLPQFGFLKQTVWNGQSVQAYVYPTFFVCFSPCWFFPLFFLT